MGTISRDVDYHFSKRSFLKNKPCADLGYIKEYKDSLFFALADTAGHGEKAYQLSRVIKKYLIKNHKSDLVRLMKGLHTFLKGTRGAVGLAGSLDKPTGNVRYVGLGNISIRKFGKKDMRVICSEGIIGYIIPTPRIKRLRLAAGEVLLLYTDGISDHFQAGECPKGFFDKDAKHIINGIMKNFYKGNDDAACIAIRYKKND